jgi:hypothetical protein
MNTLGCFWTAESASIGPTFSWLHLLPLLAIFCVALSALWTTVRLLRIGKQRIRERQSQTTASPSENTKSGSTTWTKLRDISGRKTDGWARYAPVWFIAIFVSGFLIGRLVPHREKETYYDWRVKRVVNENSLSVISRETGPFRADFCLESNISQYLPKAGYAICRIQYTDLGCMDISGKNGSLTWVKDKNDQTAVLSDQDTYKPWPDCKKDDFVAQGGQ